MRIGVLGPLEIAGDRDEPKAIRSARQRTILAYLAARPNTPVPAERLVDAVWGADPPASARAALQVHVSDLRDLLEPARPARSPGSYIHTESNSYALRVGPGELDSVAFEQLVADGRSAAADDDFATAARLLARALEQWRGDAFEDARDVVAEHAAWLDALRRDVEEDRMAAELAVGRHHDVVADLERLVEREPLRERRVQLLLLALYRCGRQWDALARYRATRTHLIDELGVEPGPELRELERAILQQAPELDLPVAAPASWVPPRARGTRPAVRPDLVARDADAKRVLTALDRVRLVGVTGPAGVGKSVLARRVACDLDDAIGVWHVDLTTVTTAEHVLPAVADGVDVREGDAEERRARIADTLRGGVLVLDDHDRVSDATAAVVADLLAAVPDLRVVSTGREPLGLPEERVVSLAPLPTETPSGGGMAPATELLVHRSGIDDWRPDQLETLAELARRLDGLPLALELAAARLTALDPADVLERLDSSPGLLRRARTVGPVHHRTLEDAVAWSHDLLSEHACAVLDECSVFAAPFSLAAVEHLCSETVPGPAVAPALAELVERSFLTIEDDGARAYRMYMPVRALGQERLRAAGREDTVRARHGVYLARLMARSAVALGTGSVVEARHELDRSLPDLRTALDWLEYQSDVDLHFRALAPLFLYWFIGGRISEGRGRFAAAIARAGGSDRLRLDVLGGAAFLAWWQADYAAAAQYHEHCLAIGTAGGPHVSVLTNEGSLAWIRGDLAQARRCMRAVVDEVRAQGDSWQLCASLARAGNVDWFDGHYEEAAAAYREGAEVASRLGNLLLRGLALRGESLCLAHLGRHGEAQARSAESLALGDELGDPWSRGEAHGYAGLVDLACADPSLRDSASGHLVAAVSLLGEVRHVFGLALSVGGLAELAHRTGEWERSVVLWSWLGHLSESTGFPLPPVERERRATALREAAAHLGSAAAERAASRGRALTLPELVATATRAAG